jgi:hypothetical protein
MNKNSPRNIEDSQIQHEIEDSFRKQYEAKEQKHRSFRMITKKYIKFSWGYPFNTVFLKRYNSYK